MSIIDYGATGANRLKIWELMTKAGSRTLSYDDTEQFWPFHEMFLNHIENMGWAEVFAIPVNGANKNLSTNFGEINTTDILTEKTNRETNGTLVAKERYALKWRAVYTFLLNSMDAKFTRHMTHSANTHQRHGPLAWKIVTNHCVKNDNQTIRRALCSAHTLNLADFDNNVDKMISHIQDNMMILYSSGETDKSVTANLFRILKKAPCEEFVSWVIQKQTIWDEGGNFDLQNFMANAQSKYQNYVKDKLWKSPKTIKEVEKESELVALNAKLERLEILLAAKDGNSRTNTDKGSSWRTSPPKEGEEHEKTVKGRKFFWCKYHKFWTPSHTSEQCKKGQKEKEETTSGPKLSLNVAAHDIFADEPAINYASHECFNSAINDEVSDSSN